LAFVEAGTRPSTARRGTEAMLSNGQKRALHAAARQAGLTEAERRLVQRNVGGFHSAADRTATREGFIAVMAFLEARCGGRLNGCGEGYWRGQDAAANPLDRLRWRIRREAEARGWTEADAEAFLASRHMSGGACRLLAEAPAYWLTRLLQALIEMNRRAVGTAGRTA